MPDRNESSMSVGVNVLALVRDGERYVFLYGDADAAVLLQTLGRFAGDKSLSFTWYDAAVLSQKVRNRAKGIASQSSRVPRF